MTTKDPVRDYLRESGCGEHVVEKGLEGLVEKWERLVESVKGGYSLGLDDYLNDLDIRQLLEESLRVATDSQRQEVEQRIQHADETMKSLVEPVDISLWGEEVAEEEEWTQEENWWYFSRPINADPQLLADIDEKRERETR